MFRWGIFPFCSTVLLVVLSLAESAPQARLVDLTNTAPNLADWKIVASGTGGPVGTWPEPPSYVPATVHLTDCIARNAELSFSVQIENNRSVDLQVPISMNSKQLDRKGTIKFRELQIRLGKATNPKVATTFEIDPRFAEILLFGNQSVPGTIAVLAPGERLLLRLKSEMRSPDRQVGGLRVRIGAFDETLSPSEGGYSKFGTWIPALSAISELVCSESRNEAK